MTERVALTCDAVSHSRIGSPVTCQFTIRNDSSRQLPAQRLALDIHDYWLPCSCAVESVRPYSTGRAELQMSCIYTQQVEDVPESFTVHLTNTSTSQTFRLSFWTYTAALYGYSPANLPGADNAPNFNLVVFGLAGGAKSSFINSVMTLLSSGTKVLEIAPKGGDMAHTTIAIGAYNPPGTNIMLRDTWGLTVDNYKAEDRILPAMLAGFLPRRFDMREGLDNNPAILRRGEIDRQKRRAHAVLFFVPHGVVTSDDEAKALSDNFNKVALCLSLNLAKLARAPY
ncbi:hypothetical protein WJX74_004150 [Apatococcus lobatus]|uniref:G domain-containing protein n=1 Tax=Apatococcus lobatus TaxID=904363 RepID=A0AAW1QMS8_9CHLO